MMKYKCWVLGFLNIICRQHHTSPMMTYEAILTFSACEIKLIMKLFFRHEINKNTLKVLILTITDKNPRVT